MQEAIIKLSSLGDIIHLALLLPMFESRQREWFVDEEFSEILRYSPFVSQIHPLPIRKLLKGRRWRELYTLLNNLKQLNSYDYVIDAQGLLKSAIIAHFLPSKRKIGFSFQSAKEGLSALFYHEHCHINYQEHILKRNAKLLSEAYCLPYKHQLLDEFLQKGRLCCLPGLNASDEAKQKIQTLIQDYKGKKIVFALESSKPNKVYPPQQFLVLSKYLDKNFHIFLLSYSYPLIAQEMQESNPCLVCLPKLSLDEVKALLMQVDLVIGGDTGVVHLAFALNIASITLFGNTPIERFALLSPINRALRAEASRDYQKDDFSIATLCPKKIAEIAKDLLR
ncbi:lipopolysaccharide heptosyltransferase I [Helicobacter monodelphidis]|uniref:lipopolysaccharide heptosyltransferase I n=1 Tax=Helicobacter sp. 15-1451 TaxID=2004995 RepID=UPI0015EC25E3|nr:lipopolysaccharide heptosyltransferase I [Helicobacter sp. 15-1451]